ncbi:hypothetical protein F5Y11DRAFT_175462 [Daldinia sp. FL1419]|nr:hypothetical protein F5Y11DRAFT_175462 [Daldinia sp. FL1419]
MVKKSSSSKPKPARTSASSSKSAASRDQQPAEPIAVSAEDLKAQQRLLNVFSDTFRDTLGAEDFSAVLQRVKQALFNRDFEAAFGSERFLEVYAARWSPPRALCYARILGDITGELEPLMLTATTEGGNIVAEGDVDEVEYGRVSPTVDLEDPEEAKPTTLKVFAIGGAAAEIVAFGDFLRNTGTTISGALTLLDTGPWGSVVEKLHSGLTAPPPLSKYASAAAKASNAALVSPASRLQSTFVQQDVLQLDTSKLSDLLGRTPVLVTLLFTLNELYTSGGIKMTTAFLRNLSASIPVDSLLLVVDSPGSYSEAAVGKEAKKYPMQWLLDHTLLQADKLPAEGCHWEKIQSHDSVWFRLGEGLRYPMDLQDMRYQMHLYRAITPSSD